MAIDEQTRAVDPAGEAGSATNGAAPPHQVEQAVHLLWISLAANLLPIWFEIQRQGLGFGSVMVAGLMAGVVAWLNANLLRGRDWARVATLALFGFSLFGFATECDCPESRSLEVLLDGATTLLELWALYLLYTAPGKTWFERGR